MYKNTKVMDTGNLVCNEVVFLKCKANNLYTKPAASGRQTYLW